MLKLTKTQDAALKLIADNEGQVIAWVRGNRNYLTINGNTEHKLFALGLIKVVEGGQVTTGGREHTLKTWALTEAGQAAVAPAIDPMHVKAYEEGRKMGLTDAQVANLLVRMG